jgi:4-aminobutyrate aminotransferase-like enzyme
MAGTMRSLARASQWKTMIQRQGSTASATVSSTTQHFIDQEHEKSAHNYHPLPRVLKRGKGVYVWDVDDKVRRRLFISLLLYR